MPKLIPTKPTPLAVCATCPWRTKMQGTKHPGGWYKLSNIKRVWNGLRTGNAPGMVCHASDPASIEYGSLTSVPDTSKKRECAGALALIYTEISVMDKAPSLKAYRASRTSPMNRDGLALWVNRGLFGQAPAVIPCDGLGFPWKQEKETTTT